SGGNIPFTRAPSPRMQTGAADQVMARNIEMGVGRSIVVDLPRDAKEVVGANPAVANAVVRSARKLFVIGVANGSTTIMALDAEGRQIAALEMQIGREPGLLQRMLKTAIPQADIRAAQIGDSIVLSGMVETVLDAQKAVDIAKGFVGNSAVGGAAVEGKVINSMSIRGRDQVMLKVTVAEINRQMLKQLGIRLDGSWEVSGKLIGGSIGSAAGSFFGAGAGNLAGIAGAVPNNPAAGGPGQVVRLNALERHGVLRTLAEPTLTAISGETAKFVAGGEIPVPVSEEAQSGSSLTRVTFNYKPYGVMLNFTPTVLSEGRISLSIMTDVTDIDESSANSRTVGASGNRLPAFRNRKAYTTIELPSGGSLVTAGLIQQSSRQAVNGLPGLMNLPILGSLFRSRDFYREETELMIMVTPYIAKPSGPKELSRPDDGFLDASDTSAVLLGRVNKVFGAAGNPLPPVKYRGKVGFIHD
ncbi:MAG: type II and III secretion system protein family protein, partial [Beijerinckiaceae bacterium]